MPPSKIIDLPPDADLPVLPVADETFQADDSELGNLIENDDGSVDIVEPEEPEAPVSQFYENLAENFLKERELIELSTDLLELLKNDKESRKKRDEQYEEGLRRTGLGDDAPGGAEFVGASKVVHPMLAEACIDFSARTMKEIFPAKGPVKTHILGKVDDSTLKAADLKQRVLNWQLTTQMTAYRDELEQLTTQEPMGGSQYMKFWHDAKKQRHCAEFVPVDMVLLPYAATSFYTSQRVTHVQDITRHTFEERVASGFYREIVDLASSDPFPEKTKSESANDKIEGREEEAYNEDGLRKVFEIYTWHKFKHDKESSPYIISIDEYTEKVLSVYRNWEKDDEKLDKLDWWVEYKFIPWRGAYGIGLPHLIGGLSAALTGALRALLDSAHINNAATMLKLKGGRTSGQNTQVSVTQVCEIEGPAGIDDVRKLAMPMPFNPPSPVLFQLLGFLGDAGRNVVATAEERIADVGDRTPVGTTLALIEQGSQVYSSIHSRHHFSQKRALAIICRLNRTYPEVLEEASEALGQEIQSELFSDDSSVEPVSDPNIFSEAQRYAQVQAVLQMMAQDPNPTTGWERNKLYRIAMRQMKFDFVDEVLPEPPKPQRSDPVDENIFATKGMPLAAFQEQDHIQHLFAHLHFCASPIYGASPLMAQPTVPVLVNHCKEHLAMFYTQHAKAALEALGELHQISGADPETATRAALAFADREIAMQLKDIMPMLEAAQKVMMETAPKPQLDPQSQVAMNLGMAEIDRKKAIDQATFGAKQAENQAKQAMEAAQLRMDQATQAAEQQRLTEQQRFDQWMEQQTQKQQESHDTLMAQVEALKNKQDNDQHQMTELLKNNQDNQTAILVERMKEGIAQSQANAKSPISLNLGEAQAGGMMDAMGPLVEKMNTNTAQSMQDTMRPLIEALGQHFSSFADSQREALTQSHGSMAEMIQGLHKLHAAPKEIIRDPNGRPIGVRSKLD